MSEANLIVGRFWALHKNGKLFSRGKVAEQFADTLRMQRINSKGELKGIFDVKISEINDDWMFHETTHSLDMAVAESSFAELWKPLTPAGLAALNAGIPYCRFDACT
jgi:hypothetical protein